MKNTIALLALAAMLAPAADQAFPVKFAFGSGGAPPGYVAVPAGAVYSQGAGYGFDLGTAPGNDKPFFFSVNAPEGNYTVTVTLGDRGAACVTSVKAESRRLMLESVRTAAGQMTTRSFTVNVRNSRLPARPPAAPGGDQMRLNPSEKGSLDWDDKLTLEFIGRHPCLSSLEINQVTVPTVFLAGDSTVTDQINEPYTSWGQMLPRFFTPGVAVANHAESGETLKSFLTGLRLDKMLSLMKPGDYLLIQFGHNDMKENWPQTYVEPFTTYKAYLKAYIAEARRRGVTPVLVTSVHRRNFDANGKIVNTLGDFPEAVRQTAKEEHLALIDLHAMSAAFYEAMGPAKAPLAFAQNGRDASHHDAYGAYELARCVAEGIRASNLELANHLVSDVPPFDPTHPDPVEAWSLPPDPHFGAVQPSVFVIGDSTASNTGHRGWGDPGEDQRGEPRPRRPQQPHVPDGRPLGPRSRRSEARRLRAHPVRPQRWRSSRPRPRPSLSSGHWRRIAGVHHAGWAQGSGSHIRLVLAPVHRRHQGQGRPSDCAVAHRP